jgi:18S rRNA (adenine1779-N6/adenine1780-N6)-dimethyltransferase
MGALAGGAAGAYGGHKMNHGILGGIGGAVAGSMLEEDDEDLAGIMDVDDDEDVPEFFKEEAEKKAKKLAGNPNRKRKGKVAELVRTKVVKVLDETALSDKRSRMCDEGDFLKLLYAFNQEGIHFA